MNLTRFAIALIPAMLAYGAGKAQCTNPTLSWTIYQSYTDPVTQLPYTSSIQGDSSVAVYNNGSSGVIATLFLCDAETLDATLTLGSPRSASILFNQTLATNSNTPTWALDGSTVTGQPSIDVRSLGFVPIGYARSQEFAFTTRLNISVPESGSWGLHLLSPAASAPSSNPSGAVSNPPNASYTDSLVNVQHCPANNALPSSPLCSSGANENWIVWSDSSTTPSQVATLLNQKKSPGVNSGQFSVPFYFKISIQ